ncbi:unnamed protein product [Diplocarpon coronariae]
MPGLEGISFDFMRKCQSLCFTRGLSSEDEYFAEGHDISRAEPRLSCAYHITSKPTRQFLSPKAISEPAPMSTGTSPPSSNGLGNPASGSVLERY